jgi:hypothetical protein
MSVVLKNVKDKRRKVKAGTNECNIAVILLTTQTRMLYHTQMYPIKKYCAQYENVVNVNIIVGNWLRIDGLI